MTKQQNTEHINDGHRSPFKRFLACMCSEMLVKGWRILKCSRALEVCESTALITFLRCSQSHRDCEKEAEHRSPLKRFLACMCSEMLGYFLHINGFSPV